MNLRRRFCQASRFKRKEIVPRTNSLNGGVTTRKIRRQRTFQTSRYRITLGTFINPNLRFHRRFFRRIGIRAATRAAINQRRRMTRTFGITIFRMEILVFRVAIYGIAGRFTRNFYVEATNHRTVLQFARFKDNSRLRHFDSLLHILSTYSLAACLFYTNRRLLLGTLQPTLERTTEHCRS